MFMCDISDFLFLSSHVHLNFAQQATRRFICWKSNVLGSSKQGGSSD